MATLSDLLTDLRDRLNDDADSQVPQARKVLYLNHGIHATWPRLYRVVRDSTVTLVEDQWEYDIPVAVGSNSKLIRLEVEREAGSGRFYPLTNFNVTPGLVDPILQLEGSNMPGEEGGLIRITAAVQLSSLAVDADVYDGPAGTEELPVLYAMGLAMTRRLDDRINFNRYSTISAQNGVGIDDVMTAGQFAFAQFELLLDRFAMPLPVEEG